MRIIDKNTDFYDYWQNVYKDDTFTFDRRDSFLLTKEMICASLNLKKYWSWITKKYEYDKKFHMLLQICNTFWLFKIEVTKIEWSNNFIKARDYDIELIAHWKNFDLPRKLISIDLIKFGYFGWIEPTVNDYIRCINTNDYREEIYLTKHMIKQGEKWVDKTIPILKACGIANCIDAHEVYLAFEEYFALEKSSTERREPLGTTDIDKIESHGFDKKTSFRGKT